MAARQVLYIQFQIGEMADIERWAVSRTLASISKPNFVDYESLPADISDMLDSYDAIIIGTSPKDYLADNYEKLDKLIETIANQNFPCFGIDFGFVAIAKKFGFQINLAAETAELDSITEFVMRDPQSEISPKFKIDITEGNKPSAKFLAYINNYSSITTDDRSKSIASSDKNYNAAVSFSSKIFGTLFIPFLDAETYPWWIRPYPHYWLNLTGFWPWRAYKRNSINANLLRRFNYRFRMSQAEREIEDKFDQFIKDNYQDLTVAQEFLRNFVVNIRKK